MGEPELITWALYFWVRVRSQRFKAWKSINILTLKMVGAMWQVMWVTSRRQEKLLATTRKQESWSYNLDKLDYPNKINEFRNEYIHSQASWQEHNQHIGFSFEIPCAENQTILCWTSYLQSYELISGPCFKLLYLW